MIAPENRRSRHTRRSKYVFGRSSFGRLSAMLWPVTPNLLNCPMVTSVVPNQQRFRWRLDAWGRSSFGRIRSFELCIPLARRYLPHQKLARWDQHQRMPTMFSSRPSCLDAWPRRLDRVACLASKGATSGFGKAGLAPATAGSSCRTSTDPSSGSLTRATSSPLSFLKMKITPSSTIRNPAAPGTASGSLVYLPAGLLSWP